MYREEQSYTHYKQPFCPTSMVRCWDECLERADYEDRLRAIQLFNSSNRWKKRDIAAVPQKFGVGLSKGFYKLQFSPDGVLMTRGPSQYKVPALCDVPAEFNVHLLADSENPHAIYLSKVTQATSLKKDLNQKEKS